MLGLSDRSAHEDLQFDRVSLPDSATPAGHASATCARCQSSITDAYYDVNGHTVCAECRSIAQSAAETPVGVGALLRAGLFGFGAAIIGAIIYYIVIAWIHVGLGIAAILTGYMVGLAIKRATDNRGGLRFQILAVMLTYLSIALAFTPLALGGAPNTDPQKPQVTVSDGSDTRTVVAAPAGQPTRRRPSFLVRLTVAIVLFPVLPIVAIIGAGFLGLITAFMMFIGMRQAWRMTASPTFVVSGPYRVSGAVTPGA